MRFQHSIVPAYLAACIILGGASAAGIAANLLLQIAAAAMLMAIVVARPTTTLTPAGRQLILLAGLLVGLFIVELIPLPPTLWAGLPGRTSVAEGYKLLGLPLPWLPLSLAPMATVASFLWLLPALATLLATLLLGWFRQNWLAWSIVGLTILSVIVGALQIGGGELSRAYFYEVTNRGFGVGFFSNANHMATLLLMAIPFLTALAGTALKSKGAMRRSSGLLVLIAASLLVVLVGLLINRSLAGWGLAIPVTAASLLMLRANKPVPRWAFPVIIVIGVAALLGVMSAPLGNNLTSKEARTSEASRYTSFSSTIAAARNHLPLGSGIGTFVDVYRAQESPMAVDKFYMNHAHSDFLEVFLEAGLPGLFLILGFLLWWIRQAWRIWLRDKDGNIFARAATVASCAVILHSGVDYPLRTAAVSSLFAACLALMANARPREKARRASEAIGRHLSAD